LFDDINNNNDKNKFMQKVTTYSTRSLNSLEQTAPDWQTDS